MDPHLVGSHTICMPSSSETQQNAGMMVAGTVPLTEDLTEDAAANGYDTGDVGPYLTINLHWRVAKVRFQLYTNSTPSCDLIGTECNADLP